jgi:peptidyl-prolyl cis-trans isomerase C
MRKLSLAACVSLAVLAPLAVQAQNVAIVNGKPVPKARVDALITQVTKQGQPRTPELEKQARDEVVMREMFMQEAEKRGLSATPDYKTQMEFARQTILIRELFEDEKRKHPVSDDEVKAEYEKFKSQSGGSEYRARHILVEKEDDAKKLIAQIKGGAKFEDVAKKNSKDAGSAENGGDLDYAKPERYVPEFSQAMTKLKKGEMTQEPVKSEHGWHIIKVEDVREVQFPPLEAVAPQVKQRLEQQKIAKFRDDIRDKSKTDYKFSQ